MCKHYARCFHAQYISLTLDFKISCFSDNDDDIFSNLVVIHLVSATGQALF